MVEGRGVDVARCAGGDLAARSNCFYLRLVRKRECEEEGSITLLEKVHWPLNKNYVCKCASVIRFDFSFVLG